MSLRLSVTLCVFALLSFSLLGVGCSQCQSSKESPADIQPDRKAAEETEVAEVEIPVDPDRGKVDDPKANWNRFEERQGRFHFRYPPEMELTKQTKNTLVFKNSSESNDSSLSFEFEVRALGPDGSLRTMIENLQTPYAAKPGFELALNNRRVWPVGEPGGMYHKLQFRYDGEGETPESMRVKLYAFEYDGNAYVFTYEAPFSEYRQMGLFFSEMIESLKPGPYVPEPPAAKAVPEETTPKETTPK